MTTTFFASSMWASGSAFDTSKPSDAGSCGVQTADYTLTRKQTTANRNSASTAARICEVNAVTKTNPRRRPATAADVERAKRETTVAATEAAMAIMLTVLLDKFNGADYIVDVWREVEKLSAEIAERRVSIRDLVSVLRDEYEINLR